METYLKPGFAQIFSCCPKSLSCPKFGGLQPPSPPGPYAYVYRKQFLNNAKTEIIIAKY